MMKFSHFGCLLLLPVLGGCMVFSGCSETMERPAVSNSANPQASIPTERYVFMTETDKQRGEVVKIFDQQTGDYWIKWVGSDPKQGKVYSVWNYFPLEGTPETGVTEIKTMSVETNTDNMESGDASQEAEQTATPPKSE